MAKAESIISKAIMDYVNSLPNYKIWRNQSGQIRVKGGGWMHLSPKGTPDLVGYTDTGQFIGIEVKTLTGTEEDHQTEFREACTGICITATSVDEVKEWLQKKN